MKTLETLVLGFAASVALWSCDAYQDTLPDSSDPRNATFPKSLGSFRDPRDGKTYATAVIGSQTWMAQNLDYAGSGTTLGVCPGASSSTTAGSSSSCSRYGRLYTWTEAMALSSSCGYSSCASQVAGRARGICPSGWHVPSDAEWGTLISFARGHAGIGESPAVALRAKHDWDLWSYNAAMQGLDVFGFEAVAAGYRQASPSYFESSGSEACFWTATEANSGSASSRTISLYVWSGSDGIGGGTLEKGYGYSLRCVKDESP